MVMRKHIAKRKRLDKGAALQKNDDNAPSPKDYAE